MNIDRMILEDFVINRKEIDSHQVVINLLILICCNIISLSYFTMLFTFLATCFIVEWSHIYLQLGVFGRPSISRGLLRLHSHLSPLCQLQWSAGSHSNSTQARSEAGREE